MLTLNVRHTLGEELSSYLSGQANELSLAGSQDIFTWYSAQNAATRSEHQKIKAVVTLFVRQVAHVNSFDCYCYPPIYYEGWKEHLIHFVFTLIPKGTILPSFSIQTLDNVIKLPLLTLVNGNIDFADQQYPGFVTQETIDSLFVKLDLAQN